MSLIKVIFQLGLLLYTCGQIHCTVSCQFDDGLCGWKVVGNSSYSWRTRSGQTIDRTSGPLNDVTCNNVKGKYAYIPGMFSMKGERALLESEHVTLTNKSLFAFWYFMNGVGTGAMEIIQTFKNGTTIEVWSRQGAQNKGWQRGQVLVEPGTFSMRFQGSVRLPYGSDIAIDDVMLESESTAFDTSHCIRTAAPTTPVTTTTITPKQTKPISTRKPYTTTQRPLTDQPNLSLTTHDLPAGKPDQSSVFMLPGSCNFENGSCDLQVYANEDDAKVTWIITDHRDVYEYVPSRIQWDHTFKNSSTKGHYLTFQNHYTFTLHPIDHMASVKTPVLNSTSVCLSFWYIMPNNNANLLVSIEDTDGNVIDVWKTENMTKKWTNAIISITNSQQFKIKFQTRDRHDNAKVALDDIVIVQAYDISSNGTLNTNKATSPNTVSSTVSGAHHISTASSISSALRTNPHLSYVSAKKYSTSSPSHLTTTPYVSSVQATKQPKSHTSPLLTNPHVSSVRATKQPSTTLPPLPTNLQLSSVPFTIQYASLSSPLPTNTHVSSVPATKQSSSSHYHLSTNPSQSTSLSTSTVPIGPSKSSTEQDKISKNPIESTLKENVFSKMDKQLRHKFRNIPKNFDHQMRSKISMSLSASIIIDYE